MSKLVVGEKIKSSIYAGSKEPVKEIEVTIAKYPLAD